MAITSTSTIKPNCC